MKSGLKNTLREFFNLPKRVSKKYLKNKKNILGESFTNPNQFWHNLNKYYELINSDTPDVIYIDLPNMNVTQFQKPISISDNFDDLGNQIAKQVSTNIHQAWKDKLASDSTLNKLTVFFRIQFENGAWRSIKSTEYYHISQLIQLGDNLQDALQGVQNMENYDFGNIIAIEAVMSFSTLSGGCDLMPHKSVFTINNVGNLKLRSIKSSNNNCGIDGLLYLMRQNNIKNTKNTRSKTIRKTLFTHNDELTLDDIQTVADYLEVNIEIWSPKGSILTTNKYTNEEPLKLFLNNNHYYVVEDILPLGHQSKSYCPKCNMKLKKNHKCPVDKFNHQKRLVHQIQKNYYDYQNINALELYDVLFEENENVIIHSEGGCGKTHLIRQMIPKLEYNKIGFLVLAPTGIAAQHINGDTIHSIFGIPVDKPFDLEASVKHVISKNTLGDLKLIIMDEISMVSDLLFTQVHQILCKVYQNDKAMGNIRVLLSGDFLQLAPITHKYCFETPIFKKLDLKWVEMTTKYRFLEDNIYATMVSNIRLGKLTNCYVNKLLECKEKELPEDIVPTQLIPKLKDIDVINQEEFSKLTSPIKKYPIDIKGYYPKKGSDKEELRVEVMEAYEEFQSFKVGTQVMFTHNLDDKVKNGTRGIVVKLFNSSIHIKLMDGTNYICKKRDLYGSFNSGRASVNMFPIQYAWAISIHKCQGITLDCAIMDLGEDIFDYHMVYVALSRVKSFQGLYIKKFHRGAIRVNPKVLEFLANPNYYRLINNDLFQHNIEFNLQSLQERSMIDMKTIFFDMETYTNSSKEIIPYYNYISVWNMGKEVATKELMLGDNSEDVNKDTFQFIIDLVEKDCTNKISTNKDKNFFLHQPYTLCAFNGSGFDFHFILNQFLYSSYTDKYELKHIVKDNKLMSIRIIDPVSNTVILRTHDVYNIIDCSLEQAVNDFTDIEQGKTTFPHFKINKNPDIWLQNDVSLELDDFPSNVRDKVSKKDLVKYPLKDKLKEYCKNDVELLIQVYRGLDGYLRDILQIDVFEFLTANMISNYGFMKNIPQTLIKCQTKYKIATHLPRYTFQQELFIRDAIIGGKAYPRIKQFKSTHKNDYYVYLDISSMYVSIMKNNKFPLQCPHWANKNELDLMEKIVQLPSTEKLANGYLWNQEWSKLPFCILDCEVELHPYEVEPPVGYKHNGKIMWDLKPRKQKYSNIAIELILKNGGKIKKIYSGMVWNDKEDYIFQEWMDKTLALKNKGDESGNNSLRVLGKLLGNSTYGGMLKHDNHMDIQLVRNYKEKEHFLTDHSFDYLNQIKDDLYYIGGSLLDKSHYLSKSPIHLGVFILDYSKKLLDDIIQTMNPERRDGTLKSIQNQPLTGDTDSLVIHSSVLPRLKNWIKKENGYLVDELNKHFNKTKKGKITTDLRRMSFAKITQAYAPIPKAYAFLFNSAEDKYLKDKKGHQYLVKIKGIPSKDIEISATTPDDEILLYDNLSFQLIDDIYSGKLIKDSIQVLSNNRIRKIGNKLTKTQCKQNMQLFKLQSEQLKRHLFKTDYLGRLEIKDGLTVPIGYDEKQIQRII